MRLHVVKRDSCPLWKSLLLYVAAVLAALVLGAVLLLALGVNPLEYYGKMFTMGMVGNKIAYRAFENYLKVFVPLVLTAVGHVLGIITPCSWVMSVVSWSSAQSKSMAAGHVTLVMFRPCSLSGIHSKSTSPEARSTHT